MRQLQEEAGSAGGQPASNKADGYTIEGGMVFIVPLFITIGILYGLKKLIRASCFIISLFI